MISIDTNVLLYAQNRDCAEHTAAVVAICELVLVELYQLLRNSAVLQRPLDAPDTAEVCQAFRRNPRWALIEDAPVMDRVWTFAAQPGAARRRLFDARLGSTLHHHGSENSPPGTSRISTGSASTVFWDP